MSTISNYTFHKAYNADKLTKQQVQEMGISSNKINKADTDHNNELTVDEIMANDEICTEILKNIANASATVKAPQQTQAEDTEVSKLSLQA